MRGSTWGLYENNCSYGLLIYVYGLWIEWAYVERG